MDFSAVFIGLLYIPITLFNVFLTLILGRLGDKIGYSRILFWVRYFRLPACY
ncbi:hypothetical protein [Acidiplasma cupricumulans]|uniref:hypothetical protein n=1 Tax=Acidiplasma cupricumulans TaxID=312540 RepID=UPI0015850710|nr:hypothetical protein [Acidiplasma cupricumulans]